MAHAVIVEAVRSPVGRRGGALSHIRPDELAARVLKALVERAGIDPGIVEDVIMGCVTQVGEQALNVGRMASLMAGFPVTTCASTISRFCGSGQQAVHFGAQAIVSGEMDVVIASGVENMSRVPMLSDSLGVKKSPELLALHDMPGQGEAAERIAERWNLSREQLDAFSLESHRRASVAQAEGWFDREIVPVEVTMPDATRHVVRADEGPRPDTSLARLAQLKSVFRPEGKITAGNSSQISDGAAALLLMSDAKARQLGLRCRGRIVATAVVGVDPSLILHGVIPASQKVLARAGLSLADVDLFEVNEAFAPVVLAWARDLGVEDLSRVNPNGGAIALGHPMGASGARIMTSLLHELERRGGRYGLQTMCIGHGMATATIIERLPTSI